jgi:hypothetical protein
MLEMQVVCFTTLVSHLVARLFQGFVALSVIPCITIEDEVNKLST